MTKRASIDFTPVSTPIRDTVTKFGGQPGWLSEPQWPISRRTGQPMCFIGQVALLPELFGAIDGQMAYLFMSTQPDGGEGWLNTADPDEGENAVIIQPGDPLVLVQSLAEGPALYKESHMEEECEFATNLTFGEDPEFVPEDDFWKFPDDDEFETYVGELIGNKIGGTPGFLQGDHFPGDEYRTLILQLSSFLAPLPVDLGDSGTGWAFLSNDGRSGKFLWQCH